MLTPKLYNEQDRAYIAWIIRKIAFVEGEFILSSGKKSSYYIDKYLFETDWSSLNSIRPKFRYFMEDVTVIGCTELGGVALAAAVALDSCKNFVIARKVKEHGTAKQIEGVLKQTDQVLLIEDVVTTGSQIIKAANLITATGAKVQKIVAVVDREEGGRENIEAAGYAFYSLVTMKDIQNAKS
jgi:orotate phosphoribosyltransferase